MDKRNNWVNPLTFRGPKPGDTESVRAPGQAEGAAKAPAAGNKAEYEKKEAEDKKQREYIRNFLGLNDWSPEDALKNLEIMDTLKAQLPPWIPRDRIMTHLETLANSEKTESRIIERTLIGENWNAVDILSSQGALDKLKSRLKRNPDMPDISDDKLVRYLRAIARLPIKK